MLIQGTGPLRGKIHVPGDKSISHRAVMLGALAQGDTRVRGFLRSADCISTMNCFRAMGVEIEEMTLPQAQAGCGPELLVHGKGLHGLHTPKGILDAGNSGTTTRLISGILAGQPFGTIIDGDASLRTRPMKRIIDPLTQMGAEISGVDGGSTLPLRICPRFDASALHAIHYPSPVASAQVKSCVLLAGMYADSGRTAVTEPVRSRDHTERMLAGFGADIRVEHTTCSIAPEPKLSGRDILVPGDISSAAYFLAAALLTPDSEVLIRNVGINPTRSGILEVARAMGGDVTVTCTYDSGGEPAADLLVRSSSLYRTEIGGPIIPSLIDELPVIAVMAAFAQGTTVIRDAAELRVKESDRIAVMTDNLQRCGCNVQATEDGMIIQGGAPLHEAVIDSHLDHRIAMSFAVAATAAKCPLDIQGAECVNISYPEFYKDLAKLTEGCTKFL